MTHRRLGSGDEAPREGHRTVQVHLTRRCNLACSHCYSDSGPRQSEALALHPLVDFLRRARAAGYERLSLSGGEPFLYRGLNELIEEATLQGWTLSAVTNGTRLGPPTRPDTVQRFALLGVSVDGSPERHDAFRRRLGAFEVTRRGLATLRDLGMPFAIVHTLRRSSFEELEWLLHFAIDEGAAALRLHPLEQVGQGQHLDAEALSPLDVSRAYLWALAADSCRLRVEVDLVNSERLRRDPTTVWPAARAAAATTMAPSFTQLVDTLVVEPDGRVVPFTYGIDPAFDLGRYDDAETLFDDPWRWDDLVRPLAERALREAAERTAPFFNWYEHLVEVAKRNGREVAQPLVFVDQPTVSVFEPR